jgi:hypothetical protein
VENAGGYQPEYEFLLADSDGMPGVMSALISGNDIEMRSQNIDDLTFAFIAPLGADDHDVFHKHTSKGAHAPAGCVRANIYAADRLACHGAFNRPVEHSRNDVFRSVADNAICFRPALEEDQCRDPFDSIALSGEVAVIHV